MAHNPADSYDANSAILTGGTKYQRSFYGGLREGKAVDLETGHQDSDLTYGQESQ